MRVYGKDIKCIAGGKRIDFGDLPEVTEYEYDESDFSASFTASMGPDDSFFEWIRESIPTEPYRIPYAEINLGHDFVIEFRDFYFERSRDGEGFDINALESWIWLYGPHGAIADSEVATMYVEFLMIRNVTPRS